MTVSWPGTGTTHSTESIQLLPDDSEFLFLPVPRTLFAAAETGHTLTDGIGGPAPYKLTSDGEVLALLGLPATVLGTYFEALGQVFTAFSTRRTNETTAMQGRTRAAARATEARGLPRGDPGGRQGDGRCAEVRAVKC